MDLDSSHPGCSSKDHLAEFIMALTRNLGEQGVCGTNHFIPKFLQWLNRSYFVAIPYFGHSANWC
jgi:hypothetical protein